MSEVRETMAPPPMNPAEAAPPQWLPLSHAQRQVWVDMRLGADPRAYQLVMRSQVHGRLDLATLRQAASLLAARHDALRLRVDAQQPRQHLSPGAALPLQVHTLRGADEAALEAKAAQIVAQVMPLGEAALSAVDVIELDAQRSELIWRVHHLVADMLALKVMVEHYIAIYNALVDEVPGELPAGSSFVATLGADEAYAASPQAEADLAHWRRRYDEVPALVFERREAAGSAVGQPVRWTLQGPGYARWRAACTQAGITDQRALAGALALAVGSRHDRNDFSIGLALHRRDARTRSVVGMFAGVLPARCRWGREASVGQALKGIAAQLEQDFRHQRSSVADIGRALGLAARGQKGLFDISLSFLQSPVAEDRNTLGGASLQARAVPPLAIVPLPLLVVDKPDAQCMEFELGHDPACLSAADARSLAAGLQRVVDVFCQRPSTPVADLEACSAEERERLLAFNPAPTAAPWPAAATLHELVRAQVRATPEAPAVFDGDESISYAELDSRSDALAARIRAALPAGVAEPVVGVALPRSLGTVLSFLAVLKAGAVYLPLDSAYPLQRLQYLLDDAGARLLIDEAGGVTAALNCLRLAANGDSAPLPSFDGPGAAQRLAYVIYTSGSTGLPKPVGMSHGAAANLAFARRGHDPIGPGDRVLAAISVGFDVSVGQLLLPLLSGAAIVIAPPLRTLQADAFWALLARFDVSHINSVPSFFDTVSEALVAQPEGQRYRGLKRLMLGGEALTGALAAKLRQRLPGTQLVNMYGPTETCIDATAYVVPEGDLPAALPIGRPLANYRAYVLDSLGRLLPPGVAGELCIAGAGLARGYLGRAGDTAAKFVADPFGEPGERLYRSGDLARWREDGQIEFLGRNDQQVKIRGQRVETGEIEATLLQHEGVTQAAVIAHKDAQGQARLLAYVVGSAESDALKPWLAQRLPEHMVPAVFITLDALPLTTNGKLDRKALPQPDIAAEVAVYEAPQGAVEEQLAALWQEMLRLPRVGRNDDFFALGGHSLLAISMVERLRQAALQVDVPALFGAPRLRDLAAACRRADEGSATAAAPPNAITEGCQQITPEMLPLVTLTQPQIDAICAFVPGGAANVQDVLPLAPLQEGMLFHHLMQPVGDVYLTPVVLSFASAALLQGFAQALRAAVARHDVLRTSIAWEGLAEPVQVVWRQAELALDEFQAAPGSDALAALHARIDPAVQRLDLRRAPLLRALAVADAPAGRWLLGLSLHHLLLDHASGEILMHEVVALQRGQGHLLPPPVPWRELLWRSRQGLQPAEHEAFFRDMLGGVHAPVAPFGLAQVQGHARGVAEAHWSLPEELATQVRDRARAEGISPASLMHLAWGLVLALAHGDETDDSGATPQARRAQVVFGTVLFGRLNAAPGVERALGLLINTLPLRVDLGPAPLRSALQATHQRLSQLLRHEHAPLSLAQRCSGVEAPAPLFTTLFNYRHNASGAAALAAEGMQLLSFDERTGYPLTLSVDDDGRGFGLVVQSVAPAEPLRVAQLMGHAVAQVVEALRSAPDTPCDALNLLPAAERERVLHAWNDTAAPFPAGQCLHTLFEAQVARTPDATALVFEGRSLSYAELNAQANRLAHHLVALGLRPDGFVGLALERSLEMVVAILATQKAGGAYVPLDPDYPADRLRYMLQDCAPRVLLTQSHLLAQFQPLLVSGDAAPQLLLMDAADTAWTQQPAHNPDPAAMGLHARHLAYLIYTSGSTGRPKGVMVEHEAVVNRIQWMHDEYRLQPEEAVLQKTPFSFDVSVWEFFWPLLFGARLVIARPQGHKDPAYLCELIRQHGASTTHFVPSMLQVFLEHPQAAQCTSLTRVFCSGEALPSALAERFCQTLPGSGLHNLYGPTEAAVDVSYHACVPGGELLSGVPIGRPVANTQLYVLDAQLQPVPVGVPGELFIAGVQVARGYLKRDELSAERFVPDPFAAQPGARMYKTGDLARWLPNGEIEYLGRNDFQVKIRGLRIELGEIEAALLAYAGLREAVVVASKTPAADGLGSQRLVAYFSTLDDAGAQDFSPAALRQHLGARLPEYMVPAVLVRLPALPLSPNGKCDRSALPAPDDQALGRSEYAAPQGEAEEAMAALWAELLRQPRVGRDDNFFALGGHSLLAVQLASRVRSRFGLELPLADIFTHPRLADYAQRLGAAARSQAAPITPVDRSQPLALSFAQQRLWFLDRLDAQASTAYHIPGAVRLRGALDVGALHAALARIVARHEALRTRFASHEGSAQQLIDAPDVGFTLMQAELSGGEAALPQALQQEATAPFSLQHGPLIRGRLLRLGAQDHVLLVTMHHIVSDGWSLGVLVNEIAVLYGAFVQGHADPLPPLPLQYADFAAWQRQQLRGDALQQQLQFWQGHLAGAPALLELPTEAPRPAVQDFRGEALPLRLSDELSQGLQALSQRHGCTLYMTLLAGWAVLLARSAGQAEVVVGSPVANRTRSELEGLIGFFVNTLALRIDVAGAPSVAALLAQVRAHSVAAQAHQDLPFEQLVEVLKPPRSRAHSPLFQVMFALQNTPPAALALPGLQLQPLGGEGAAPAKFDLTLDVYQTGSRIEGTLTYALSLFSRARMQRHIRQWQAVLQAMVADEACAPSRLPLMDAAERAVLLQQFNPAPVHFDLAPTLHEEVAAQVQRTPTALALRDGELQLSYAELDAQATALARRIRAALPPGRHEPVVAVALPRSAATVVALLATLKAQAVYLPLDTDYPLQRLQYLLDDAGAALLIDEPGSSTAELRAPRLAAGGPQADLPPETEARRGQRLAYVIYTSGSTGLPKPVGMGHGAALNLSQARQVHDPIGPGSRVLAAISVGFDVSIGQLLLPLLRGAAIVIAPPLRTLQAREFWALLRSQGVTHINSVPSFFDTVSEALPPEGFRGLQRLMLGGEALTGALVARLRQRLPGTQIVNMYGPTESCIDATAYVVPEGGLPASLPIGRPLPNYRVHVLDAQGELLPIGVPGELCIAGAGLARGYLGRPDATAEKFVADGFGAPGERLYRSGDLARWREDGQIEFLGRNDQQVKIRGQRIETGEIEAALLQHEGVAQAAVLAQPDANGQKQLVAYLVCAGEALEPAVLKPWLAQRLTDAMVPAAFVMLEALPLTPNGKLDRKALPAPDAASFGRREFAEPVGEAETAIAELWAALLKQPRVGRHDSFFELGGHSLLAIQFAEQLRQRGFAVEVGALFEQPTLQDLAQQLQPLGAAGALAGPPVPPPGIPAGATAITPDMLPMLGTALTQPQIDRIVAGVAGGAANVQDIYPLVPLQEGMLFHHLMHSSRDGGDVYITPTVLAFPSRAAVDAFVHTLRAVLQRHDALRTSLAWEGLPAPVQVVWRHAELPLEELRPPSGSAALDHLRAHIDARHARLDLRRAPLLRLACVQDAPRDATQGGGRWLLGLAAHHIAMDYVSGALVLAEAAALRAGQVLPPPLPFREGVWRARHSVPQAEHEAFFRQMLADVDSPTAPYGLLDTQAAAGAEAQAQRRLPEALSQQLRRHTRALGVSPASLMHLAWALVLARISTTAGAERGDDDVVFGTVLTGRTQPGAAQAVGMFINTLPLRLAVGRLGVAQALQHTQRALAQLMRHEQAPLSLAQRCSGVVAPTPLFSALFNYRSAAAPAATPSSSADDGELLWTQQFTGYPLSLAVDDDGQGFGLNVLAVAPAQPDAVARLMLQALQQLAQALQHAPDTPCRTLDLLDEAERHRLLHEFNPAPMPTPWPAQATVHELVGQQVRATPDAPAVFDGEQAISYAELDARSDTLARRLVAALHGAGPEPVVGVALPRSADSVLWLLAVLKAGAVYLPLDLAYPAQRLQYMLDDAGAVLLIDEQGAATAGLRQPRLPPAMAAPATLPALPADTAPARAQRLAYVIYTSGSTGLPKPVGVSHAAAVNLAFARRQGYDPLSAGDRILAATSVGFDVSFGQLVLPLISGAAIVICPPLRGLQAQDFWALVRRHGVTHINLVPSLLDTLSENLDSDGCGGLKRLLLGGEALNAALVAKLRQRFPGTPMVNIYGPTETCIDATAYRLPDTDAEADATVAQPAVLPIGQPLANYRCYVLDGQGRLAPQGVAGELCIAGAGLARGYLRRPADTAAKFQADSFGPPGERLYRSGDLARWRADGQIEYLGRNDQQVKIRGQRVEVGEIEATLLQHPGITQAAVVAQKDGRGQARLLAYLVAAGDAPEADTLKAWLAERLPEHMVPAVQVWLDALPLNTNGKLDRKALPAVDAQALGRAPFEPPQGEAELLLAGLWQELLGAAQVGRQDDFFALGGQSLLAITLVERLRQAGMAIDVPTLFAQPRLAAMAAACRPGADGDAADDGALVAPPNRIPSGAQAITPELLSMVTLTQPQIDSACASVPGGAANVQDIYPLAPLQEGMLFHHLMREQGDIFVTPMVMGFALRSEIEDIVRALQQVIARHDILRTSIAWEGQPEPLQLVWRQATLQLEELPPPAQGAALDHLVAAVDARTNRLDLKRAPLMRALCVHDAAQGRWLLALCLHHLMLDHTSMDILMQEVAALRQGLAAHLSSPVPYRQAVWHALHAVSREAHEEFFRGLLADVQEPTLPYGLADAQGEVHEARLVLDAPLAQRLRGQARAAGVSAASLMHLAWGLVVARTSAREDVVFGTVLFGRLGAGRGSERALGMLINTLPLRMRLGQASVAEALQQTHALLLQLMRHEHAPLALAQRCSGVAAPAPLFSAIFNFRHQSAPPPGAPALPQLLWGAERTGYPLALAVNDDGHGFSLDVQSIAPAQPEAVGRLMLRALQQLADALDHAPSKPCHALELLDGAERARLLAFNPAPTAAPWPAAATLHELVRAQVRATPEAPAVFDGDESISYAELDSRSDALAARIRAALPAGVAEPVVGVALPRSLGTVVVFLAVLKAGAVYLPLDSAYPLQRLQYLLDDAGARLLIDEPDGVTSGLSCPRLPVDGDSATLPSFDGPGAAQRLAYVIYTSGSTGLPKPVGMSHGAAANLAFARRGHDPIGPGDRVLAAISVGFDVSVGQLLLPLLSGAAIVIAPPLRTLQADAFWALLARFDVSHINSVPSFFDTVSEALVAQPEGQRYRGLKRLMLGGEALTGALAAKLRKRLPGTQLVNMYGPTETCIDATAYVVPEGELGAALPIGRPLANYRAYVLDGLGRLLPPGVAGELCIAGAGLARGYLGRAGDTAAKFVADPFGAPGERLYRSGDLARWREDGQIEFLGRNDQQVKIRGQRVETGEIEATLLQHEGVTQAAVIAHKDAQGQARLLAYVVGSAESDALKPWLAQRLPEHMVPAVFITLDALPLTTNGKLDRKALPAVDAVAVSRAPYVAPRDALEAALCAAWQQAFQREPIGIDDDFFALGGHSLLALRVITACQALLRADPLLAVHADALNLRALMGQTTVAALAQALRDPARASQDRRLLPLRASGSRTPLFCVHPQAGTAWVYTELTQQLDAQIPVYGLQARGLEPGENPLPSVEAMAQDYVQTVQRLQPQGPYQLLGFSSGGVTAFEMARQLRAAGHRVNLLALLDSPLPSDADNGEPSEADVLFEAGHLVGITEADKALRNAQELRDALLAFGLVDAAFSVADAQRGIDTALQVQRATRRYRPQPMAQPLLQIRALRRDTPSPDWTPLAAGEPVPTHDLDCGHMDMLDESGSAAIARLLQPLLN